jgi:hypothetical protein
MYTLAAFRATLRSVLKDKTVWRDTMLNGWINDAVRDYSNYFPMEAWYKIDCSANVREYELSTALEVLGVINVEYPDGRTPPRYLQRLSETHPNFWDGPYYDIRQPNMNMLTQGEPAIYPYLVIGEKPAAADDIIIRYLTVHRVPSQDCAYFTIPDEHFEAIRLFVYWKAIASIALDQDIDAGRKSNIMTALGGTTKDAEYAYHYKLRSFQGPAPLTGIAGPWPMDKKDRIY